MEPFVGNDYRKRVLAAVDKRGGAGESDVFELYDIPIEEAERLGDDQVLQRLDEVWAFWQKQRDHPKYRVLVARLVAEHDVRSAPLRHKTGRIAEARAVRTRRELRDQKRFELLDNAIARLNERYGGIPASKRQGLDDIGAMGGLTPAEIATRLRRHRLIDDPPPAAPAVAGPAAALTDRQRSQIGDLLAEFDRLRDGEPTPTLLTFLHLDTDDAADHALVGSRAAALNERARELAAGRMRAVIDELLVHVNDVLLTDPALAQAYRQSVVDEVTEHLRPRVRAAVLVEDELGAADHEFLLAEAGSLGLGARDARQVIAAVAHEFGARVVTSPAVTPGSVEPPAPPVETPSRRWENDLRAARAALRDGLPFRARTAIAEARAAAGDDGDALRQIAAVAAEIDRVADKALGDYRHAQALVADNHHVAALELFEALHREARDVDLAGGADGSLDARLDAARALVRAADELARAAAGDPGSLAAVIEMRRRIVDHEELNAVADRVRIEPPRNVRTTTGHDGTTVSWEASPTPAVVYRVVRIGADGSTRTLGRTPATELSDGGTVDPVPPVYEVTAVLGDQRSEPARSGPAPSPTAPSPTVSAPAAPSSTPRDADPPAITAVRVDGDTLRFDWPAGVTEAMVVIRPDTAPDDPADPRAVTAKVTNTRYQIDDGYPIPPHIPRPCHVAVASCRRTPQGALAVASSFGPSARAEAGPSRTVE
ncbi:Ig-like domain repeat protein [Gordonia sp. 'Campus']|uniref:Ig-like domain repeat protein n=1 Tax=Gordonia sp. 'Campus' TaxID=2915824 RepID=UPI001EE400F1|nr:Ig-like domain repeat protein [Gordonia sp. 'Campus']